MGVVVFAVTKLPAPGEGSVLLLPGIGAIAILSTATSEFGPAAAASPGVVGLGRWPWRSRRSPSAAVRTWRAAAEDRPRRVERARLLLLAAPGLSILIVVGTTVRQVTGQPVAAELAGSPSASSP